MQQVAILYNWLGGDVSPRANQIFGTALLHAEPGVAERIAGMLLPRRHESAWVGLVGAFDRLGPNQQREVRAQGELVRAGIAGALKSPQPRVRLNAVRLMGEFVCPGLLYVVSDMLRGPAAELRDGAVQTLRQIAELFAPLPREGADAAVTAPQSPTPAERAGLTQALADALRTYEVHRRTELLEACLWFAPDLGDTLWDALATAESPAARAVEVNLRSWNSPRLAAFLLLALARSAWRATALSVLARWNTRAELLAFLAQSALLRYPAVREGLQQLRRPVLLAAAGPGLSALPAEYRKLVPRWILHLGFTDDERLRFLRVWLRSSCPALRRGAVYALASLGYNEAQSVLELIAQGDGPTARFARWYVAGRRAAAPSGQPAPADAATTAGRAPA